MNYFSSIHSENAFLTESVKINSIEDKMEILDQIIHQILVHNAIFNRHSSSFGTIRSSLINQVNEESYKVVKVLLDSTAIPEKPEFEENSPMDVNKLRSRAKIIYDKLLLNARSGNQDAIRSITPIPSMKKLNN